MDECVRKPAGRRRALPVLLLLLAAGVGASCSAEPRQIKYLRKVAATLPVPDGTDLIGQEFVSNRPEIFDDRQYSATLPYETSREVDLEEATEKAVREFESVGWNVVRDPYSNFVDENLVAHRGGFTFEKGGESGSAYLGYVIPPGDTPLKKPAKVMILLSLYAT